MGNVCNSGQKKKKDSASEKSEDSYKIENAAEDNVKSPENELSQTKIEDNKEGNVSSGLNNQTSIRKVQEDISNVPEQPCTEKTLFDANKEILNTDLCKLLGRAKWNGITTDKMNKIIIYLLMDNSSNSLKHKHLLYNAKVQLEKLCEMHNFECVIADVHNNISEYLSKKNVDDSEKDRLDINYWSKENIQCVNIRNYYEQNLICMSEMKRHLETSYVIPILIFGSSLGIPMLPLTIERNDFLAILNKLTQDERLLFEKWYIEDQNIGYNLHIQNVDNRNVEIEIEQNNELNKLLQILVNCLTKNLLKSSYISTIIEQELNDIIINNPEVAKRCIWIQNDPQYGTIKENATPVELEIMQRIAQYHIELKTYISEKNLIRIPPNIKIMENELISILERILESTIQCIIEEHSINYNLMHNTNGIDHILIKELEFINHYTKKISKRNDGADNEKGDTTIELNIKRYLEDGADYPLIISGPIGSGKTTLIAKISSSIHEWKADANVILRYAKLTAESSDLVTLLGTIVNQMSALINGNQIKMEHTLECYSQILCDIIENRKCFFVIIIDSIDELLDVEDDGDIKLNWLPLHMYNMCKIILTISEGNGNSKALIEKLKQRDLPERAFQKINALSQSQWNKMLKPNTLEFNVSNKLKKIPFEWYQLHGQSIFHVKSLWWLLHLGNSTLSTNNITEILEIILNVMNAKLSPEYVECFLLIICLPEWGIRESDCINIFKNITKLDTQNILNLWARFCWIISPILLDIGNLRIIDNIFKYHILQKYHQKHLSIHLAIRDYYEKQEGVIMKKDDPSIKIYNYAKYLMEPYHHMQILLKDKTDQNIHNRVLNCAYFTDIQWILDKVNAVGPLGLIHDIFIFERINRELTSKDYVHINFLKKFLIKYVHELNYDGNQFITLFKYYIEIIINDSNNLNVQCDEKIRLWLQYIEDLKTPLLEILNNCRNNDTKAMADGTSGAQCIYGALINLPNDGYFIASLSALKEQVCIWDVQQCVRVRILDGIPHPTAMCPFGSHEAAVLCRREIKVIDMDEGKFKVTLKGVMNQKMPYFGLHDQKHLVCLSRNRMYVNLMDLESGDCVTTFKAGEDRFLNSLLVSGDGRILVCGDETQKPFPLLVWHLSQRKLLYDLRIPCHDFITSLSAITYEGSYVCVVAKELNEPAPNFIVVYDLQSGTLFKKWKPTCNTVALAISQLNACVIAGLYDAKILIWDLVTGNCRATLIGHNAPVTCLKLDPLGKVLLSTNKEGRDNSLRLWELNSGNSLAVFKPPGRVSACEILPNGNYVAIALFDRTDLLVLALRNYKDNSTKSMLKNNTKAIYGKLDNQHKVFKLEIT